MRPLLALVLTPALLTACATLPPPAPPPLPTTAYPMQVAAALGHAATISPLALWHAPGGAHLDLLIASPSAKVVADFAQFFQSSASSGPIEQALALKRPDGSAVNLRPVRPGSPPLSSDQPPLPIEGSRPACIATLTFRCSVKPGEKLILSLAPLGRICGGDPQFARPNDHPMTVQDLADRPQRR